MAVDPPPEFTIQLDDEIDGDQVGSRNYRFSKIGEPVPINSDGAFEFEPDSRPSQPLAVSERFRLLFVAHPQGFYVARTKDVMASAEEIKEKKTGFCIQELCLVDVPIGKVSILAMSADDSLLAASVGSCLHFFAVSALLHKEQKPSFSVPLDDSVSIKDVRWDRKVAKAYLILSSGGKLYHGSGQGPVTCVMEDVDSVDWSIKGDYIAMAKKNVVSILSKQFKEKIRFLLSFQSVIGDSDANKVIRVDSIRWSRPDSIVVGCFQLNDDGEEENYIVQVITSRGRRITDEASKPTVLSFNAVFLDWFSDAVPTLDGPHLLLSYLDLYGMAFVANRNLSPQVALFCWQANGNNEAAMVEILNDAWALRIDSQGNGDENVIIGLSVDKVSQDESRKLTMGDEEKEVSPCCVIICLTIDGKISVFHFASAAGAIASPEGCASDEEDDTSQVSVKHEMPQISSAGADGSREPTFLTSQSHEHSRIEVEKTSSKATTANDLSPFNINAKPREENAPENMGQKPLFISETLKLDDPEKALSIVLNQDDNAGNQSTPEVKHNKGVFSGKAVLGPNVDSLPKVLQPATSAWSLTRSNARDDASKISDGRFLPLPSNEVGNLDKHARSTGDVQQHPTDLKEKPSVNFTSPGQTVLTAQRNRNSQPAYVGFQVPLGNSFASGKPVQSDYKKELNAASSATSVTHNAQNASKQFGNVEEMAKKLDILLEDIEEESGFRDASITSQTNSLKELEEGVWALSDRCRIQRGLMNEQQEELQLLLDKTVEVLVRKVYVEGIFKQATNSKYWELWNRQKLSSELELKWRRILELDQELTNKLIELERHFNSLEFSKFRENEGTHGNRRALQNLHGHSRQIQSLRSLHNTMVAQLAAAEQLSGCLSKQMAALSIESSGKHDLKRQLFESIGLNYAGDTQISPARNRTSDTPANKKSLITSGSSAAKGHSRRNQTSFSKGCEPETAASQRRDSFDRSWASFDPPKTTLKRMLKEDNEKGSSNRSLLNISKQYLSSQLQKKSEVARSTLLSTSASSQNHYKSKGFTDSALEQFSESPSTSLHHRTTGLQDHGVHMSSTKSFSALPPPSDETSNGSLHLSGKTYSFPSSESKLVQQSDASFHPLPSTSTQLPGQSLTSPFDSTETVNRFKIGFTKSTSWDQKNTTNLSDTPSFDAKIPVTSTTAFSSDLNISEKGLFSKISSSPLQPVLSSSLLPNNPSPVSLVSKPNSSTVFLSSPKSSDVKQQISQPRSSVISSMNFPSTLPSLTRGSSSSSVSFSSNVVRSEDISEKVGNMPSKTETGDIQTSPSRTELISTSGLKPGPNELPTNLKSESQDDLGGSSTNSPVITSPNKIEMPSATEALPAIALSSEGNNGNMKTVVSISSHEEEMEEEAPEADQTPIFAFSNLGGFGTGQAQNSPTSKTNPFGVLNTNTAFANSPYTMPNSSGELFRPASFSFQSPQPAEALQPTTVNFSSGFSSGSPNQASGASGFGQPAQIGAGQQALGSVLGSFGQSRQIGSGLPGGNATAPASGFGGGFGGGFVAAPSGDGFAGLGAGGGGFAAATTGGGFAAAAGGGGGFAAAAAGGGGGFAAAAAGGGGGFAAAAGSGGGFAAPAGVGGGFGGGGAISGGGFGAFSNQAGAFGGGSGTARPSSELFTQMRK